jgi:hypothetical protein
MNDDSDTYLFVVSYEEDKERKRVEYLFDTHVDGTARKPDGLVRLVEGVDHEDLYADLVSKVPSDAVSAYRLNPVDADVEPESIVVDEEVAAAPDAVESFVEYVLSKKKAVLTVPSRNEYEVYTKKGRAEVSYELSGGPPTTARLQITGYPPAPTFLADFFREELTNYADSQR